MQVTLSDERKELLRSTLGRFWRESFDEELSAYRSERIIEFFLGALGAPLYNQAIQDARGFMLEKLDDLDAEFYRDEPAL